MWQSDSGTESKDTKAPRLKAGIHRDLYAPNRFFSLNTAPKNHGRRQPCRDFLSCLAGKFLALACFAVLKPRFFLAEISRGSRNTFCISRTMDFLRGKRFLQNRVNPYGHPPKRCLFIADETLKITEQTKTHISP